MVSATVHSGRERRRLGVGCASGVGVPYARVLEAKRAGDGLGICHAFFGEDAGSEGIGRVGGFDGAGSAEEDRAGVVRGVAEVNGAAGDRSAGSEDGAVDALAEEARATEVEGEVGFAKAAGEEGGALGGIEVVREEGGVDVEDGDGGDSGRNLDLAEIAGEDDKGAGVIVRERGEVGNGDRAGDDAGCDVGVARDLRAGGVGGRDDQADACGTGECAIAAGVEEVVEGSAAA